MSRPAERALTCAALLLFIAQFGASFALTNFVVVRGQRYAALADFDPKLGGVPSQTAALPMPGGWSLANNSRTSLLAIWMLRWGDTNGVILADGSSWRPNGLLNGFETEEWKSSGQVKRTGDNYEPTELGQHMLITAPPQAGDDAIDQITRSTSIGGQQYITYEGLDYATMDLAVAADWTPGCQTKLAELTNEWQVAADNANTRIALLGRNYPFQTHCVLIGPGTSINTITGETCRSGVSPTVFQGPGWWVARPPSCVSLTERIAVTRTSQRPNSWVVKQDGSNMKHWIKGFDVFATIGNEAHNSTAEKCEGTAREIPDGWNLVSPSTSNAFLGISAGKWGTVCLVLSDGSSWQYSDSSVSCGTDKLLTYTDTATGKQYYATEGCNMRILLHRPRAQRLSTYSARMNVLVLTAKLDHPSLPVVKHGLDAVGAAYEVHEMDSNAQCGYCKKLDLIDSENVGNYYAVVATQDMLITNVSNSFISAMSADQWNELREYMFNYNVRYFSASTDPFQRTSTGEDFGLTRSSGGAIYSGTKVVFDSVPGFNFFGIDSATSSADFPPGSTEQYRATEVRGADTGNNVTVLAHHEGTSEVAIAQIQFENNREELHVFYQQNDNHVFSHVLATLWVPWVTRGLFLGERRQVFQLGVHDVYATSPILFGSTSTYRMTAADLLAFRDKCVAANTRLPAGSSFKPEIGFHGFHASTSGDALYAETAKASVRSAFRWINQMWKGDTDFALLSEPEKLAEMKNNLDFANTRLFSDDSSKPGFSNTVIATPLAGNLGLVGVSTWMKAKEIGANAAVGSNYIPILAPDGSPYRGRITSLGEHGAAGHLIVPRFVTTLYSDASTPAQQEARYQSDTAQALSTSDQIAKDVSTLFHNVWSVFRHDMLTANQVHLRKFNATDSLLSVWLDKFVALYSKHYSLPLLSVNSDVLKQMYLERVARDDCGINARFVADNCEITSVILTSTASCTARITGAQAGAYTSEKYGPDDTLLIPLVAGETKTVKLSPTITLTSCDATNLPSTSTGDGGSSETSSGASTSGGETQGTTTTTESTSVTGPRTPTPSGSVETSEGARSSAFVSALVLLATVLLVWGS